MPEQRPGRTGKERSTDEPSQRERSADERQLDHDAIARLAGDLLPALVAKLSDSGLGEIEVREGSWRVRVRRPVGEGPGYARRSSDRASRAQPGHAGHGHPPAGFEGHRSSKEARESRDARARAGNETNGSTPTGLIPVGPGAEAREPAVAPDEAGGLRTVATSPAVGVYQPRADARPGSRVRAGDRLGAVDMLGIPQEVVAPIDGIVGASLIEPADETGPANGPGGSGASDGRATRPAREP